MVQTLFEPPTLSRHLRRRSGRADTAAPKGWLRQLRQVLDGRLIQPGEDAYESARVLFDQRFDPHPEAIALCRSERDVRACLAAAQRHDVAFRIRAGGHSFAGYSACDGLIIDVAGLDDVSIDRGAMTATVGGGCQQGKLKPLLDHAGLFAPIGDWPGVCIGGFMQGGGFGPTSRTFGLNCDHVAAVRMMLADGRIVVADERVNRDLWWAVRGGTGGNFGVVLDVTYRLRKLPVFARENVAFSLAPGKREQGVDALLAYQAGFMLTGAPDTLNSSAVIMQAWDPAEESPWLVIQAVHVGAEAEMMAALQPLLSLPGAVPGFDPGPLLPPDPIPPYSRSSRLIGRNVTQEEWRALLTFMDTSPNRQTQLFLKAHGGAINSYPRERSAFIHRDAHCNMFMDVFWPTPEDRAPAEAFRDRWRAHVAPLWNGHIYQNFPEADAPDYRWNYWGDAYRALAAVKAKYDPTGAFKFEQSIEAGGASSGRGPPGIEQAIHKSA